MKFTKMQSGAKNAFRKASMAYGAFNKITNTISRAASSGHGLGGAIADAAMGMGMSAGISDARSALSGLSMGGS